MLQRRQVGGAREQKLIGGALQSAERAKTLVQRLLAFARRQPLKTTAVDVGKLLADMADLVASSSGPQINIVVQAEPALRPAAADRNQLEMAILNLAVNARDAMPLGGTLTISAAEQEVPAGHASQLAPGAYVSIRVADTGQGMDEATARRAIEPFFSTKGIGKGTGLGPVHGARAHLAARRGHDPVEPARPGHRGDLVAPGQLRGPGARQRSRRPGRRCHGGWNCAAGRRRGYRARHHLRHALRAGYTVVEAARRPRRSNG
jgi:K+-sensing histidine kinase KdpD